MNYLPILAAFAAIMLLGKNQAAAAEPTPPLNPLGLLSNPNALSALSAVSRLMDKATPREEKSSVFFELIANPFVTEFLSSMTGLFNAPDTAAQSGGNNKAEPTPTAAENAKSEATSDNNTTTDSGDQTPPTMPQAPLRQTVKANQAVRVRQKTNPIPPPIAAIKAPNPSSQARHSP